MDKLPSGNAIVAYILSVFTAVKGAVAGMDVIVIIGVAIGVATFCVNWFYKHQQHRRDEVRLRIQQQDDDVCSPD